MKAIILCVCLALGACSASPTPATALYATAATLDQAEVLATAYVQSPAADPTVVAQIKQLDNVAYAAAHPVTSAAAAGGSPMTAAQAEAAQAALTALTNYLTSNGVH